MVSTPTGRGPRTTAGAVLPAAATFAAEAGATRAGGRPEVELGVEPRPSGTATGDAATDSPRLLRPACAMASEASAWAWTGSAGKVGAWATDAGSSGQKAETPISLSMASWRSVQRMSGLQLDLAAHHEGVFAPPFGRVVVLAHADVDEAFALIEGPRAGVAGADLEP